MNKLKNIFWRKVLLTENGFWVLGRKISIFFSESQVDPFVIFLRFFLKIIVAETGKIDPLKGKKPLRVFLFRTKEGSAKNRPLLLRTRFLRFPLDH